MVVEIADLGTERQAAIQGTPLRVKYAATLTEQERPIGSASIKAAGGIDLGPDAGVRLWGGGDYLR